MKKFWIPKRHKERYLPECIAMIDDTAINSDGAASTETAVLQ